MTEETNDTQTPAETESPNAKRMRERMEAMEAENAALHARVKLSAFKEAGLDPEKGIGKAVYRTYDGDVDPENIRQFAETEYDWQPEQASISAAQQRISSIGNMGTGEEARNRIEEAEAAAQKGDWVTSAALKDRELLAITQKRNGFG